MDYVDVLCRLDGRGLMEEFVLLIYQVVESIHQPGVGFGSLGEFGFQLRAITRQRVLLRHKTLEAFVFRLVAEYYKRYEGIRDGRDCLASLF